jgi:hypothetical protein
MANNIEALSFSSNIQLLKIEKKATNNEFNNNESLLDKLENIETKDKNTSDIAKEYTANQILSAHRNMIKDDKLKIYNSLYVEYEADYAISDNNTAEVNLEYFSAESVSDRIVTMAKSLSGGDLEKLETLKSAINSGYQSAISMLGFEPDISKQTYDLVQEKIADYEKSVLDQNSKK